MPPPSARQRESPSRPTTSSERMRLRPECRCSSVPSVLSGTLRYRFAKPAGRHHSEQDREAMVAPAITQHVRRPGLFNPATAFPERAQHNPTARRRNPSDRAPVPPSGAFRQQICPRAGKRLAPSAARTPSRAPRNRCPSHHEPVYIGIKPISSHEATAQQQHERGTCVSGGSLSVKWHQRNAPFAFLFGQSHCPAAEVL